MFAQTRKGAVSGDYALESWKAVDAEPSSNLEVCASCYVANTLQDEKERFYLGFSFSRSKTLLKSLSLLFICVVTVIREKKWECFSW